MGYFDSVTAGYFKRSGQKWVFYPWGFLGSGYELATDEQYRATRFWVQRFLQVTLALSVLLVMLAGLFVFLLAPLLYVFYALKVRSLTNGLVRSRERMTVAESYVAQAQSHSAFTLWLLEITALLFATIGIAVLWAEPEAWLVASAMVAFFGVGAVVGGYMIRAKRAATRAEHSR